MQVKLAVATAGTFIFQDDRNFRRDFTMVVFEFPVPSGIFVIFLAFRTSSELLPRVLLESSD